VALVAVILTIMRSGAGAGITRKKKNLLHMMHYSVLKASMVPVHESKNTAENLHSKI
jgi:hypothetical protein